MSGDDVLRGFVSAASLHGGRVLVDVAMQNGQSARRVELFMPGGLTWLPPSGTDVAVLRIGGMPNHRIAIADCPAQRVEGLAPGEVGLRDSNGQQVVLSADGVTVTGATAVRIVSSGPVVVEAPSIKLGSDAAAQPVRLANGAAATKVFAE